jgi:hypothetical protein
MQTATLCTFIASLTDDYAYQMPKGYEAVGIPLTDLARGRSSIQRNPRSAGVAKRGP